MLDQQALTQFFKAQKFRDPKWDYKRLENFIKFVQAEKTKNKKITVLVMDAEGGFNRTDKIHAKTKEVIALAQQEDPIGISRTNPTNNRFYQSNRIPQGLANSPQPEINELEDRKSPKSDEILSNIQRFRAKYKEFQLQLLNQCREDRNNRKSQIRIKDNNISRERQRKEIQVNQTMKETLPLNIALRTRVKKETQNLIFQLILHGQQEFQGSSSNIFSNKQMVDLIEGRIQSQVSTSHLSQYVSKQEQLLITKKQWSTAYRDNQLIKNLKIQDVKILILFKICHLDINFLGELVNSNVRQHNPITVRQNCYFTD
ncbi:hypothetical protein ABPG72_002604 [Tetrahymena utriculariae]